jgi:peptide/nickel transport system permease protein
MFAFVVRRVVLGTVVLGALSLASFVVLASEDVGLKQQALLPQYWKWLKGVFTGDSFSLLSQPVTSQVNPLNAPVATTMEQAIGHTLVLLLVTFVLVVLLGAGLALLAASRRGSVVDFALRSLSYLAWGVPAFLLAMLVQRVVHGLGGNRGLGPFPLAGWPGSCPFAPGVDFGSQSCSPPGSGLDYVANVLRYITLPALTLALAFIGLHARYLRAALLETLEEPFVVTARAKGLAERSVLFRHALRISLPVFFSAVLSDFGAIFGAALAVDWMFELNGLGTVLISDFPTDGPFTQALSVQMVVVVAAVIVLASSFLAEVTVAWLDPRRRAVS